MAKGIFLHLGLLEASGTTRAGRRRFNLWSPIAPLANTPPAKDLWEWLVLGSMIYDTTL